MLFIKCHGTCLSLNFFILYSFGVNWWESFIMMHIHYAILICSLVNVYWRLATSQLLGINCRSVRRGELSMMMRLVPGGHWWSKIAPLSAKTYGAHTDPEIQANESHTLFFFIWENLKFPIFLHLSGFWELEAMKWYWDTVMWKTQLWMPTIYILLILIYMSECPDSFLQ